MALIAHWPLDGNSTDYTVNRNNGTPNNHIYSSEGKIGQTILLNGTGADITLESAVSVLTNWSVTLWVKPTVSAKTFQFMLGPSTGSSSDGRLLISRNGFVAYSASNTYYLSTLAVTSLQDKWSHLTFLSKIDGIDLYVDGVFHDTIVVSNPRIDIELIGNGWSDKDWTYPGYLNDVRVYDHTISQKEIKELTKAKIVHYTFNSDDDKVYDNSDFRHDAEWNTKATYTSDSVKGSGGYQFVNGNRYETPLNWTPEVFTVNICAKFSEYSFMQIGGADGYQWHLKWRVTTQKPYWNIYNSSASYTSTGYTTKPALNEWHMYTLTYDGSYTKVYLDGVLENSISKPNQVFSPLNYIESGKSSGEVFRGVSDEYSVYSTALSDDDILELYKTKASIDNKGNLWANEFVEDFETQDGIYASELFIDNNIFSTLTGSGISPITNGFYYEYTTFSIYRDLWMQHSGVTTGHQYYLTYDAKTVDKTQLRDNNPVYMDYGFNTYLVTSRYSFTDNSYENLSHLRTAVEEAPDNTQYRLHAVAASQLVQFYIKDIRFIDLTAVFGAGNEPTKEQVDIWYANYTKTKVNQQGQFITQEFTEETIAVDKEKMKIYKNKIEIIQNLQEGA